MRDPKWSFSRKKLKSLMSGYRGIQSAAGEVAVNLDFDASDTLCQQNPLPCELRIDAGKFRSLLQRH